MPKLTAKKVGSLKKPGFYGDGEGLYLKVGKGGARSWILRTVVHGRRRDLGLGSASLIPLSEARTKAREFRRIARESETPRDRLLRKANKMRMRLGGEPGAMAELPDKPKGMWGRTYDRELDKIVEAENLADAHFLLWFTQRFPGQRLNDLFG